MVHNHSLIHPHFDESETPIFMPADSFKNPSLPADEKTGETLRENTNRGGVAFAHFAHAHMPKTQAYAVVLDTHDYCSNHTACNCES